MTYPQSVPSDGDHRFEQAAQWYLRLRGDLNSEELLEWERWYAYPENQQAWDLVRRISPIQGKLRRPELLSAEKVHADEYDGSVSVSEWVARAMESHRPQRRWWAFSTRSAAIAMLAAGVVACALLGTALITGGWWAGSSEEPLRTYQTRAGQHQFVTLSDGSTITLGARTRISTHYSDERRIVRLEEGEALFSVAKNEARPFTVVAAGGAVTAVGTRFNVRSDLNRVTVTVTEGAVDVVPAGATVIANDNFAPPVPARRVRWDPARVVKGEEVTYEETHGRGSVAVAAPGATEWISGRLQYRQVPLKYVAADVQRYFNKKIVLGDPAAGEFEFTGTIYQAEVGDWFRALEMIFPLDVHQADEHVLIQSRADPRSPRPAATQ